MIVVVAHLFAERPLGIADRRAISHAELSPGAAASILFEEAIFNLSIDLMQPLLGAFSLLPIRFDLGLELSNAILSSSKLVGKPLRRVDGVSAVLLGNIGGFMQELEDRLTGFVELTVIVSPALSRSCKRNHFGAHCDCLSLSRLLPVYRFFETPE